MSAASSITHSNSLSFGEIVSETERDSIGERASKEEHSLCESVMSNLINGSILC
jgi:hypothetical protein